MQPGAGACTLSGVKGEFWRAPIERFSDACGEMALGSPAPGVLCTRAAGRASAAMAEFFLAKCDQVVGRAGTIEGFHEWSGLVGYEPACRSAVTDWSLKHRSQVTRVHVFVTQRLVRMGVTVTSLVVPMLESHESRVSFVAAFERVLTHAG